MDGQSWAIHKQVEHEAIERHIAAFIARGGVIEVIGNTPVRMNEGTTTKQILKRGLLTGVDKKEPANANA